MPILCTTHASRVDTVINAAQTFDCFIKEAEHGILPSHIHLNGFAFKLQVGGKGLALGQCIPRRIDR